MSERESIVKYLREIAQNDKDTILFPESRQVVEWCAAWIENRLDEKAQPEPAE